MVKLAIICAEPKVKLSAFLTQLFTGCPAYHSAWVDEEAGLMWQMGLLRNRRKWPHYGSDRTVYLFDTPVPLSVEFMEEKLSTDQNHYGWYDYTMFLFRNVAKRLGLTMRNHVGTICSEMIVSDLIEAGWKDCPPEWVQSPPSPCDLLRYFAAADNPYYQPY